MKAKEILLNLVFISTCFLLLDCSSDKESKRTESSGNQLQKKISPLENKGVGPIKNVVLEETISQSLAHKGKEVYEKMCTACHKIEKKYIGPSPKNILQRRSPEWIMNMILNPEIMVKEDPVAKQLLIEYNGSPMANQNLTKEQARSILEYFRTLN